MNLQTANTAVNLASNVASIVPTVFKAIKKGSFEIKYFRVLPEEYNKEVKLAKERKKNGDTFSPTYEEYLSILEQGKKEKRIMVIKWERHYRKSNWVAHIIEPYEQFEFEN